MNKYNTYLWGFEYDNGKAIVDELSKNEVINIVNWVSRPYAQWDIIKLLRLDINFDYSIMPEYIKIYNEIKKDAHKILSQYSRIKKCKSNYWTYFDMIDAFNIYFNLMLSQIIKLEVNLVIFANIPHHGVDYIFYKISKILGIKVIMCYQSIIHNTYFLTTDIDDFGFFKTIPVLKNYKHCIIEEQYQTNLFYMNNQKTGKNFLINLNLIFSKITMLIKFNYYYIISFLTGRNYNFKLFTSLRLMMNNAYMKRFDKYQKQIFDIKDIDFVYFPLAMQPELTTSSIGGDYVDQALAIERLSAIVPEGWKIIIKENPKQTYLQRGELFFRRLNVLKNVIFVGKDMNTYFLIQNSKFVAVVTGTAGWEAIKGGKPVVVFGRPWYLTLPGVFIYSQKINPEKISLYKINHFKLEKSFSALLQKSQNGIVDRAYSVTIDDFNIKTNAKKIVANILEIVSNNKIKW